MGMNSRVDRICKGCVITLANKALKVDFRILDMTGYDVILGMDWLTVYRVLVDCHRCRIIFFCQLGLGVILRIKPLRWGHGPNSGLLGIWVVTYPLGKFSMGTKDLVWATRKESIGQ